MVRNIHTLCLFASLHVHKIKATCNHVSVSTHWEFPSSGSELEHAYLRRVALEEAKTTHLDLRSWSWDEPVQISKLKHLLV